MAIDLAALVAALRASRAFAHKRDIAPVVEALARAGTQGSAVQAVPNGDDCAALVDGDGYTLLAIEGFINEFVAAEPWFAGWCGVMVNLSDVAAMGGRPLAVVDALWSAGEEAGRPVLQGLADACAAYGVPLVGGHTNARSDRGQLAVSVLGRARRLLSSFDARPGDRLLMAVDLRGRWHDPHPFWDAATGAPPARLRAALDLLPQIAEAGLSRAAKDISNAGVLGTALMLLECSGGLGARLDLDALPHPPGQAGDAASFQRWLLGFPSFGFLLAARDGQAAGIRGLFESQGIACADIGVLDESGVVSVALQGQEARLWDFRSAGFIGCGAVRADATTGREPSHATA